MSNRHLVDAPVAVPYRYGLFSVVDPRPDADPHWRQGVTWETQGCAREVGSTLYPCLDAEPVDPLTGGGVCDIAEWDPFTLYAFPTRSLVAGQNAEQDARDRLTNGEQYAAETILWGLLDDEVTAVDVSAYGGVEYALGYVEQAVTNLYGSRAVIHVNRLVGSLLYTAGALKPEGGNLITGLGTPVIIGGGYDTDLTVPPATLTVVGSGPIVMYRGPIETATGYDRDTNTSSIIAQRDYLVGWDCAAVAASTTIDIPED